MCLCLLLAAGANVHAKVAGGSGLTRGSTALHLAAEMLEGAKAVEVVHLLLAAGADLDAIDAIGDTPRKVLSDCNNIKVDHAEIEAARRRIATTQLDLVRKRAMHICIGLQSLRLDALQLCEILQHAFGAMASMIAFHQWWAIATTVKHFK